MAIMYVPHLEHVGSLGILSLFYLSRKDVVF